MPRLSKIGAAALAAFGWTSGVSAVSASYLVVAGGGGGGHTFGGGGGAGGLLSGTTVLTPTLSYTITVGAGGTAVTSSRGNNGSDSVFNSITATGGGGGGDSTSTTGKSGGSGGGGAYYLGAGGSGTVGQGNNGGANATTNGVGGGGGGAGAVGATASSSSGAGGIGLTSSITGTSTYYAGGGGGSGNTGSVAAGGLGGGGAGGVNASGTAGTANTGGGGGGGTTGGAQGGSGIVIISYVGAQQFGGGVVTSSGGNTIHTFTTSGTLVPITPLSASYLIVAGGGTGGAGSAGGGGAGGVLTGSGVAIDPNSTYLVTVGAGGAAGSTSSGNQGSNSSWSMVSTAAVGGGGGGAGGGQAGVPTTGGSGGGGGSTTANLTGAAGTAGQGFAGGNSPGASGNYPSGGGGGAGGVGGTPATTTSAAGNGGIGISSSISGTATYYGGGGGGGVGNSGTAGTGGLGGGGNGGVFNSGGGLVTSGTAGTANTGGGSGGGGPGASGPSLAGGSGIVIISYAGATQLMAGGTVTISGGNVIHTFTSTGYLTPLDFVGNSLRFRSSASAYLNRTFGTPTLNTKWTWSAWVKRGTLGDGGTASTAKSPLFDAPSSGSTFGAIYIKNADNIVWYEASGGATVYYLETSQVFRDPAAWYHFQFVYDSTEATAANRQKMYVNGVQVTAFSSASYVAQNTNGRINSAVVHKIGSFDAAGTYFDGYMTEVNFIDGQALTPNSFGTFNSYGVWQPITYGGSYGINGFYLPFTSQTQNFVGVFNGTNQYLSAPSNSAFAFGTGDFTVECYAYFTSVANFPTLTDSRATTSSTAGFNLGLSTAKVQLYTTSQLAIGATTLTANRWYHIAVTRSGTTLNIWVNGFKDATITNSTNWSDTTFLIGATPTPSNYMTGSISNLRVVKGTAVYTSDFTPATSALTNISGTSLLTLQNATIIDNSTNAFTITNNNTVTTSQTYPFSYAIFNDRSPQGNNWTPNNISGASGTTLDYMTDVPTLTSATAANYAVVNPLDFYSNPTVTNGNLQFATSGAGAPATSRATIGVSSGKWYWEVTQTAGSARGTIGIILSTTSLTNDLINLSTGYSYNGIAGNKYNSGTATAYGASYTTGDVIGVALDMDAGTIVFYKNNTSQGTAFTGLSGTYSPAFADTGGASIIYAITFAVNFGQRPFTYTPPSGFVGLNTFNL
jgi:hypothetical protein